MSKHTSHRKEACSEHGSAEVHPSEDTSENTGAPEDDAPPNQAPEAAGEAEEAGGLEEKVAALEAQLAEARDQFLRKAADFENFRKRINREKQEAIEFANQALLLDLIPIIDDLERAVKSAESRAEASPSPDFTGLCEGIGMIEKRLVSQLEHKWGLKRFDSAGAAFDPTRHEAIMMEKSGEITEPVVQEDLIKGYMLKDRVIRSAKVKVLMPESPRAEGEPPEGAGGSDSPPA
ncbi:MAG: nucleotide exchange factor GrpE [Spirochaetaceae bacterium]|jgi:molecular chaperone GrpE|nr:nucleotide exchange factor GrpE [Spirochaetaceae bacterium]